MRVRSARSGGPPASRPGRRGRAPPTPDGQGLGRGALEVADGPAAAGDHDDRPGRGQAERPPRRRPRRRRREPGSSRPRTCTTRAPGPAIARTSGIASAWATRCRSAPGWAQKRSAATSVTTATTGTGRRPIARRRPRTSVVPGYVDTTTSAPGARRWRAAGRGRRRAGRSRRRAVGWARRRGRDGGRGQGRVPDRRPEARPLQHDPLGERAHGGQAVDDLDRAVRRALRQLLREDLRGDVVPRADRGAEDDAAQPRRGPCGRGPCGRRARRGDGLGSGDGGTVPAPQPPSPRQPPRAQVTDRSGGSGTPTAEASSPDAISQNGLDAAAAGAIISAVFGTRWAGASAVAAAGPSGGRAPGPPGRRRAGGG